MNRGFLSIGSWIKQGVTRARESLNFFRLGRVKASSQGEWDWIITRDRELDSGRENQLTRGDLWWLWEAGGQRKRNLWKVLFGVWEGLPPKPTYDNELIPLPSLPLTLQPGSFCSGSDIVRRHHVFLMEALSCNNGRLLLWVRLLISVFGGTVYLEWRWSSVA